MSFSIYHLKRPRRGRASSGRLNSSVKELKIAPDGTPPVPSLPNHSGETGTLLTEMGLSRNCQRSNVAPASGVACRVEDCLGVNERPENKERGMDMEKRRFGRTGHMSTVGILGAFAFSDVTQEEADEAMKMVIEAGINHIDVAPTYGEAELRLGPWLARVRDRFFVGCKTMERTRKGAAQEMRRSLERLQMDRFDLYQLHAVTSMKELDQVTGPDGALQAIVEARDQGLTRFIGITGHGLDVTTVFKEALTRFDFDSVLFSINFVLYADADYRRQAEELVRQCTIMDVGTMIIKSVAKGLWGDDEPKSYNTWYKPFDEPNRIQDGVNFALSQDVTGLCTVGDVTLLPSFVEACERFKRMKEHEQEALIATTDEYRPIFT